MTFEKFNNIINSIRIHDERLSMIYSMGIDLLNITDDLNRVIKDLFNERYNNAGWDWFTWFLYELPDLGEGAHAWDLNNDKFMSYLKEKDEHLYKIINKEIDPEPIVISFEIPLNKLSDFDWYISDDKKIFINKYDVDMLKNILLDNCNPFKEEICYDEKSLYDYLETNCRVK